jgi:transposase
VTTTGARVQIPDEQDEQVVARAAAIDVGKEFGKVCTRVPHPSSGRRVSTVWDVPALTNAICALADDLAAQRIERVTIESTSDYWRPFYYLLEARGLNVQLVNARDVKNVPGRPKTDKLDAVWLAKLTQRGMLRASFVPDADIRALRDFTRLRTDLTRDRTRHWQRLEKLLEDALIKVSTVASKLDTVSVRDMLDAMIDGERDPRTLARLARGRMKIKYPALVEALTGRFDDHHALLTRMLLDQIDALNTQIDQLTTIIDKAITALPAAAAPTGQPQVDNTPTTSPLPAIDRLAEIPGVNRHLAHSIIAEIGLDMSVFPTAAHLVSWAKLSPRTIQSGATNRTGKTGKGNPYIKAAACQGAAATARTHTFLGDRYRRLTRRRGKPKALVAVARTILTITWHLLADPTLRFHELGPDYYTTRIDTDRKIRNHIRQLQALGYSVTLEPAT